LEHWNTGTLEPWNFGTLEHWNNMKISNIEAKIVEEFSAFDDWMDRYNYLIEIGKGIKVIDEKYKVQNNLISGCQSRVWLHAEYREGKIFFSADSDAVITKGLASLMIRVLDGQTPDDILHAEFGFIERIGLKEHLSPTRSNGLASMIKQMKLYALAFKTKGA
jgi:cysteine desulfuration protein SufE